MRIGGSVSSGCFLAGQCVPTETEPNLAAVQQGQLPGRSRGSGGHALSMSAGNSWGGDIWGGTAQPLAAIVHGKLVI